MRDLKNSNKNELTIYDKISDTKVTLFYRTPTTKERIQYKSALINTSLKSKELEEVMKVQINWAKELLTGFSEGSFCFDDKPISAVEDNANYNPGWKEIVAEGAADILLTFVEIVLDSPNYAIKGTEIPFVKSSVS